MYQDFWYALTHAQSVYQAVFLFPLQTARGQGYQTLLRKNQEWVWSPMYSGGSRGGSVGSIDPPPPPPFKLSPSSNYFMKIPVLVLLYCV